MRNHAPVDDCVPEEAGQAAALNAKCTITHDIFRPPSHCGPCTCHGAGIGGNSTSSDKATSTSRLTLQLSDMAPSDGQGNALAWVSLLASPLLGSAAKVPGLYYGMAQAGFAKAVCGLSGSGFFRVGGPGG